MPKRVHVLYDTTIRTVDKLGKGMEEFEKAATTVRANPGASASMTDRRVIYVPEVDVRVVEVRLMRLIESGAANRSSYTLDVFADDDPEAAPSDFNRLIAQLTAPPAAGSVQYPSLSNYIVPAGRPIMAQLSVTNGAGGGSDSAVGVEITSIPLLGEVTY